MIRVLSDVFSTRQRIRDFGTCLKFNGTTDLVSCGTADIVTGNEMTISGWLWVDSTSQGTNRTIIAKRDTYSAADMRWQFSINNSNRFFVGRSGSTIEFTTYGNDYPKDRWFHVALTKNASSTNLYINSELVDSGGAFTFGSDTASVIKIGATNATSTDFFKGMIDELKVFSSLLTDNQVEQEYTVSLPTTNLVAYYKFDEESGTTANDSAGSNTGTITGATYSTDVFIKPRTVATNRILLRDMVSCLSFDGVDDVVTVANATSLQLTGDWSASAWILPITLGEGSGGRIFEKNAEYGFFLGSNADIAATNFNSTKTSNTNVIKLGRWQHIAVTYSDSNNLTSFFWNGTAVGTSEQTTNPASSTNSLLLGNRPAGDRTFRGLQDEICLYKGQALTQEQIQNIYFKGIYPTTGLSGLWLFNEESGTSATDSSGNSNTGTITGATYSTDVFLKTRTIIS